jgi:threonylcarbamoyladenosine tRNA methylthiotransferase MtaB
MNIFLDTIGCRLNQSEIEAFALQFRLAGHTLVANPAQADLVVVNTCAVTAEAASDSRQKIRQAARHGKPEVVVTGCWATLEPIAAAALPNVSRVVPNLDKDHLVTDLLQLSPSAFDQEFLERQPLPGSRQRTRAFIKIQDGCDNHCSYCVTTLARGSSRSRSVSAVLHDIQSALAGNAQEIVLTGVHLGAWGYDLQINQSLCHLIKTVLNETNVPRLRLSSLEPWDLEASFFELWQDARLCRHLHLPLQSGSAATLHRMQRKITPSAYSAIVQAARSAIPNLAITTDIIVGFPGETDTEFSESLGFIQEMDFAGGHVFTYSARPGTPAARMNGQIPHPVRKERNANVRAFLTRSSQRYTASFLDTSLAVLWESSILCSDQFWELSGLTDNYLRVTSHAKTDLWNQISLVHLNSQAKDGMQGIIWDGNETHL